MPKAKKLKGTFFLVDTESVSNFWSCVINDSQPQQEIAPGRWLHRYETLLPGQVLIAKSNEHPGFVVFAEDGDLANFREELYDYLADPFD